MACAPANNPYLFYNQCSGVAPGWFLQNDGCLDPCGCIPIINSCPAPFRRYSTFCKTIDVTPAAPQVFLRVAPSVQADSTSLTFAHSRAQLQLFYKGCDTLLATYPAWRRDANGYIGFYFDDAIFAGPPGYYVGDVYIDCCYCFSVTLRKPACEAFVTDCYVQPALENCGEGMCSISNMTGVGTVGGLNCNIPPAPNACGSVAPYYPQANPPAPPPVCTIPACNIPPTLACGSTHVG